MDPQRVRVAAPASRRRTPGLRREEVAALAGVSVDWYIRLEQGRAERPSPSVLDALSRTFDLSADERAHVYALARAERPPLTTTPHEEPDAALLRVLRALPPATPAMVLGRRWDVLAWNDGLSELLVPFDQLPQERRNLVELTFLDPRMRERYAEWPAVAEETVANFRASVARNLELPDVRQLVTRLITSGEEFAQWWRQHEVREKSTGVKVFRSGGQLIKYRYDTLLAPTAADQRLIAYTPED